MLQHEPAVRRLLSETHWPCDTAAARTTYSVVMDQATMADKAWLPQERREKIGEDTGMDEQHRLAVSSDLELEFNPVHGNPIHFDPRRVCGGTILPVEEA
jgi:hypothetical protein